jgi:hypothetical protein
MRYHFNLMQVGDTMEIPEVKKASARVALHLYKKKNGGKFSTKRNQQEDGTYNGITITRVE